MRPAVKCYTVLLEFLIALGILPGYVWSVPTLALCPYGHGWGETGSEAGICPSSETTPKNAYSPSRPAGSTPALFAGVHALLGGIDRYRYGTAY